MEILSIRAFTLSRRGHCRIGVRRLTMSDKSPSPAWSLRRAAPSSDCHHMLARVFQLAAPALASAAL